MSINVGDLGEARFIAKCIEHGYMPCKPFSQNTKCDIVLVTENRTYKAQIKSTNTVYKRNRGGDRVSGYGGDGIGEIEDKGFFYEFVITYGRTKNITYNRDDIDLLVLYCMPDDDFYLLGRNAFEGQRKIKIYKSGSKYMHNKNRFDLL